LHKNELLTHKSKVVLLTMISDIKDYYLRVIKIDLSKIPVRNRIIRFDFFQSLQPNLTIYLKVAIKRYILR